MRIALLVVLWSHAALAIDTSARDKGREGLKQAMLQAIESSPLKNARLGAQVLSLDDGAVVFARDADELLNPASNVKLFTAAAALSILGTDYRFDTEFMSDQPMKSDGRIKTLYVRGHGDPTMTSERLYGVVADLLHAGVKDIGDIVMDDDWFDSDRIAPGYDQEFGDKAYLAPTGALSLNWNSVGIVLRPGDTIGSKAFAEIEPPSDYFTVDSNLVTGTRSQRRYAVNESVDKDKIRQKIEVRGMVPVDKGSWTVWKKVDQPALYFGFTLKQMLSQRGIRVRGKIKMGNTPNSAKTVHVERSETLDIVLKKLNKTSQNFVAEQLVKTIGAEVKGAPGSHAAGIEAIESFLVREVGLSPGSFIMRNGSGLNDTNRFSAAQMVKLLKTMWERFPIAPEYLSSLPVGGKDGTLKFRFEGSDASGRLRAKTGTLETVTALSGYVQAVGGERFVFSFMLNDFAGRAGSIVQHLDSLGAALAAVGAAQGPQQAVASMTKQRTVVGSYDELKARMLTYNQLATQNDTRNIAFLRTAFRSEKDPALRAVIADALFQADPREPSHLRMLLDSTVASDDVWGRIRRASVEAKLDTPLVHPLVEAASAGSADAVARLFELSRSSAADPLTSALLAEQLAVVASEAPNETFTALQKLTVPFRDAAVETLARGFLRSPTAQTPFVNALKKNGESTEASVSTAATELLRSVNSKIAGAAQAGATPVESIKPGSGTSSSAVVPGG